MYLKSVEINGFKSFSNKVKIDFKKGITSIVGPNGSGKSNILDAVIWVFGEQSYKNIRAKEGSDVIFSGTDTGKKKNFAEVSLTIENSDNKLDIDYNEIVIKRRIFKSGENEYFINKKKVRLKDLRELFLDTGIGKNSYSIIGQGKVEQIVQSSSKDIKGIIEEAAGIKKHNIKKSEAESKLDILKTDIEKIEILENEIKSNLEPLEVEAEKARKYLNLKEELDKTTVSLLKKDILDLTEKTDDLKDKKDEKNRIYSSINEEFVENEEELETINLNREKLQNWLNEKRENNINKKSKIDKLKNERILSEDRKINLENEKKELNSTINKFSNKKIELESKLKKLKRDKVKMQNDYENQKIENVTKEKEIKKLENEYKNYSKELKEKKEKLMNLELSNLKLKNSNEINTKNLNLTEKQLRSLEEEITEVNKKIEDNKLLKSRNIEKLKETRKQKSNVEKEKQNKTSQIEKLKNENYLDKKELSDREEKLNKLEQRGRVLTNLKNNYEGFFKGVKEISKREFDGVVGPLISILKIPEKFEIPIQTAVGNGLQDIVVDSSDTAKLCIKYLSSNKKGRASFLPLDTIKVRDTNKEISRDGVYGYASDLVKYENRYNKAVKYALGNLLIVENKDVGIRILKTENVNFTIVTLDGDILSSRGRITGGEKVRSSVEFFFNRNKELNDIQETIKTEKKNIEKTKKNIKQKIVDLEDYEKEITGFNNQLFELEKKILKDENVEKEILNNEKELYKKLNILKFEKEELNRNLNEINSANNNNEKDLNSSIKQIKINTNSVEELEKKISHLKIKIEEEKNRYSQDKIKNVEIEQQHKYLGESINEIESSLNEVKRELKSKEQRLDKIESLIIELSRKISNSIDLVKKEEQTLKRDSYELKREDENYKQLERKEKEKIQASKSLEKKLFEEKNEYQNIITKYEKSIMELKNLKAKLEEYDNIENIPISDDKFKMKSIIKKLNYDIDSLGEVNVFAIKECKKVKEKYSFLCEQKNDLLKSRNSLNKLIEEIEDEILKNIKEAYKAINQNFTNMCEELLNGARGSINLSNEENILDSNFEIYVRFKNKKNQALTLLSGGEKSMVAVAFILAIFLYKPSPFTFFDEIEAALDETNTISLLEMLRRFTEKSQFIMITHNKETMKNSDVIYGVTMKKEEGISKVVSMEV